MKFNRILLIGIILSYSSKLVYQEPSNNEPIVEPENKPNEPEIDENQEKEPHQVHHGEGHSKIPFGTPRFYLYILYAFRKLKSHLLCSWDHVRTDSRLFINKPP